MLDSNRAWGTFQVGCSRYGLRTCRLIVYPPGIDRRERLTLRAWRAWPIVGGVLCVLGIVMCLPAVGAALCVFAAYLVIGLVLAHAARRSRRRVREEFAIEDSSLDDGGRAVHVRRLAALLDRADSAADAGTLTPVQYECVWAYVYARVAVQRSDEVERRRIRRRRIRSSR